MKASTRKRIITLVAIGGIGILTLCGLYHRELVSPAITARMVRECQPPVALTDDDFEDIRDRLIQRWGGWLRHDYFDRRAALRLASAEGCDELTLGAFAVIQAYYYVNEERFHDHERHEIRWGVVDRELQLWLEVLIASSKSRELLVNLLISDYTGVSEESDRDAGLVKLWLIHWLLGRPPGTPDLGDLDPMDEDHYGVFQRCVSFLEPRHWRVIIRDLEHPREKVRSGALLLLLHHPDGDVSRQSAHDALDDPSQLVRLAAAGTLALRGDRAGWADLIVGLNHSRWEVRWWAAATLASCGTLLDLIPIEIARVTERDRWVRGEMKDLGRGPLPEQQRQLQLLENIDRFWIQHDDLLLLVSLLLGDCILP